MASKRAIPVRVNITHKCHNENSTKQPQKSSTSTSKPPTESTSDKTKPGVLRARNPSASNGKVPEKTKPLITSNRTSVKSFSEQRKEKQLLEEQLIKLKNEVELLNEEKKQLSQTNSSQRTELDSLVEKNKDLEERMSKVCDKLDKCERHLENLGYDPVNREKLKTMELDEQADIENTVISVTKFQDGLVSFKERNTQIISSIEEILKTV